MVDSGSKLWAIVRREYIERVRTRWFMIATLFAPLLFAGITFLPILLISNEAKSVKPRIVVLDATQQGLGDLVARSMRALQTAADDSSNADVRNVSPDSLTQARTDATNEVVRRLASGYIVLDSTTLHGGAVSYAGRRSDSRNERVNIANAVRSGLIALRLRQNAVTNPTIDSVVSAPVPRITSQSINDNGVDVATPAKSIIATIVAFFLYMLILLYGQNMLSGVIEEKMSRVSEIVISSVKPETLLAGKVIGVTAVGLTQTLFWIGGSAAILSARAASIGAPAAARAGAGAESLGMGDMMSAVIATPWSWVALVIVFCLLGLLFYGALYAAVGSTVGTEQDARQAAFPVVMLLVLTAVLISPTIQNPTSKLAVTMSLLPFSSPIIMPMRMAITNVPLAQEIASLGILIASCLGAIWLAGRIYRVGLLMYGKRPTLRELRRWVMA